MAQKERKDAKWLELCKYVEKEIYNYDSTQKLQRKACLVLKGLTAGQVMANNNCDTYGSYSYDIILLTFKAHKSRILGAIKGKNFTSESSKMSYVCAIVRENINDIATKYYNSKKSETKIETMDTNIATHTGAEYKSKGTASKKPNDKFGGLW